MGVYMKGFWPTPIANRPSEQTILRTLYNQGFTDPEELATAYAILRAESGGDPRAFLSYVDVGTEANYKAWKKEHPGKVALEQVRKDLKAIPTNLSAAEFKDRLDVLRRKYKVAKPLLTVTSWDRGLFQISSKYHPDLPAQKAFTMYRNARKARDIYEGWGNSWNAWATYTNGNYKQTLPAAQKAVNRFLAKQKVAA